MMKWVAPHKTIATGPTTTRRSGRTIRQKMVFLMALLVGSISLFIYLFFPARLHEQATEAIVTKASSISEVTAYALGPALDFNNIDEVEEVLQAALQFEDVVYAVVRDANGTLAASFVRDSTEAAIIVAPDAQMIRTGDGALAASFAHGSTDATIAVAPEVQDGLRAGGALYHARRHIASSSGTLGTLYMGFSLTALNEAMDRSRTLLALVSLLVFIIGMGATYGISVFITRPLGEIVHAADCIAQGDLTQRAAVASNDEVGHLARSFNKMVDGLEQAYEALQTSESRSRAFIEHATDIIGLIDQDGRILYLSPSVEDVMGYQAEDLTGKSVFEYVHSDDQAALQFGLRQGASNPGATLTAEVRWRHQDGSWRYLSYRGRSLLDHPGIESILINARDITETKQFEQELMAAKDKAEEMVQLKNTFLANMSHEIRTPLTGILGYAQVLGEEVSEEQRELVDTIRASGQRLMNTLNSVLDLAQLEARSIALDRAVLDVAREAAEAVQLLKPLAREAVILEAIAPPEPVYVDLDPHCLHRIFNNLVGNAIKFTERGRINVEIDGDEASVYLRVRDTGVGISKEFLPHIFDEFKQESTGISRSHEGNGLGLSITKQLTELMDGTIVVESIKGLGSIFTITFPRAPAPPQPDVENLEAHEALRPASVLPRAEDRPPIREDALARAYVLVVEDNVATRNMIERMLSPHYDVAVAANSSDALKAAAHTRFDAILMDINLGDGKDGVDTMRDLRTVAAYQHVPVIAVTAYAMPGDAQQFLDKGFDDYLSKPFQSERLLGTLARNLC